MAGIGTLLSEPTEEHSSHDTGSCGGPAGVLLARPREERRPVTGLTEAHREAVSGSVVASPGEGCVVVLG